jgi:hypothetical protein
MIELPSCDLTDIISTSSLKGTFGAFDYSSRILEVAGMRIEPTEVWVTHGFASFSKDLTFA